MHFYWNCGLDGTERLRYRSYIDAADLSVTYWSNDGRLRVAEMGARVNELKCGGFSYLRGLKMSVPYVGNEPDSEVAFRAVVMPYWAIVGIFAIWPLWCMSRRHPFGQRARGKRGLCMSCGYDLRGWLG